MLHSLRVFTVAMMLAVIVRAAEPRQITLEELVRRTQEMFSAVAIGDRGPWERYWAEDGMLFDEKGRSMDKAALVKDIEPLPPGYSGDIKVTKVQSRITDSVAVLSYDLDETETIFGQNLRARYHGTDTWLHRQGRWQIVAGQVLRYYEDPAPGKVDPKLLDRYLGVYELTPGVTMTVSRDGDRLFSQRADRAREELMPEACDIFFRKGVEGRRLFHYGNDGAVDALIDRRNNEDLVWKKIS